MQKLSIQLIPSSRLTTTGVPVALYIYIYTYIYIYIYTGCDKTVTRQNICQVALYDHWHGRCGVYIDCEENGDTSKHLVFTGPTASQSTCHGDDNHWADIDEEEIVQFY